MRRSSFRMAIARLAMALAIASVARGAEGEGVTELRASVPEGYANHRDTLDGSYWIPRPLKEKYDGLLAQVRLLRKEILEARIEETEARRRIDALRRDLDLVKREIEAEEILVTPAKVHRTKETRRVDLGPEGCLLIEAGQVKISGWDEAYVECVLEKIVLTGEEESPAADFEGIGIEHRQVAAEEAVPAYLLAAGEGAGRGSEGAAGEEAFLRRPVFGMLAGKTIDVIRIRGLVADEGNRSIGLTIAPEGSIAGKMMRSEWKRHASLTIRVPRCNVVAVRGALRGLDAESLEASLAIADDGGWDRDYGAACRIRGVAGSVAARNVPIALVEGVKGDVSIAVTKRLENVTTFHDYEKITTEVEDPRETVYRDIRGDFRGWFGRANLRLERIGGTIDVRNDAFETVLVADAPLAKRAHRIVSEAGHIRVEVARGALGDLPVMAFSSGGYVRIPAELSRLLESRRFSTSGADGIARSWEGFAPKLEGAEGLLESMQRPDLALRGCERSPGLDLISRLGSVRIELRH